MEKALIYINNSFCKRIDSIDLYPEIILMKMHEIFSKVRKVGSFLILVKNVMLSLLVQVMLDVFSLSKNGIKNIVFTISLDNITLMPCNPSIGGPAKGHLVREIDALGGEMGKNIDKAYMQIKLLNTSRDQLFMLFVPKQIKRNISRKCI